jgi:L-iditol 2-dehydrogenase
MKVAVYYDLQDIRIEERPEPKIGEDEILVQMKACGVCGSDLMDWYLRNRAPLVLGHEPTGIVAKKGKQVDNVNLGDRVFVHHHAACMTCHYCLNGDYTLCERFHETNIEPGGFAEYFRVPSPNLRLDTLKIPESLSFEEATLIEPVGCCIRALKKCGLQYGDTVAIIGAGPTGLIHTVLAKTFGASAVIVSDFIEARLNFARKFGADRAINPKNEVLSDSVKGETDGRGVDIAVVTAPSIEAYKAGLDVCRKGGKLCVFAPTAPGKYIPMSPKDLFFSEIRIVPSYSTSHIETRLALDLMISGKVNLGELISHKFELDETAKAFETALNGEKSLKVVVLNN